jgi:hypothetical protein
VLSIRGNLGFFLQVFVIQRSCRIGAEVAMGKPYSQDFHARVITAVDGGIGVLCTADRRGST